MAAIVFMGVIGFVLAIVLSVFFTSGASSPVSEDVEGTVNGVMAESDDTYYTIHSKAVIIATGGFGNNQGKRRRMVQRVVRHGSCTGDGSSRRSC